ncbi:MAG TPA: D-alanyl-D-alanine carboxypeptidase/D-alanyl-D-alanine-endopeptidase [Fimbriimonadaceae bacterium]|nr:D-alanyl-D-alanine carboxypeptidase/D-alanyl-D-alanine-endopeptidase [Fimbriimonadaceae bacterium]
MLAALLTCLIPNDLDKILDDPRLAGAIISCCVADESGATLYERNSSTRVMPASNQKLLTNSFALAILGPGYQPKTRLWRMRARVVVDSPGDPMMTHERLTQAAAELHLKNIREVDVREAYRPLIGPSWEWDDLPNRYAAPISAFTVDRGSVELWGQGDRLWVEPRFYWLEPQRGTKTGPTKIVYDPIRRTLTVNGELPKTAARLDTLSLDQPDQAASMYLGRRFRLIDQVPSRTQDLTLVGPPLSTTMKDCLVHSDNNLAENLLLMAASKIKPLGRDPYADADQDLTRFLTQTVGEEPGDFHPEDGSGMSRHDLVTTRGIVKLLQWDLRQSTKDVWLDALAKPGAGTLADRLKGVPFAGKTGTLDMVVALSGYVHTKKDRILTVSLILNHFICKDSEARAIADAFIEKLADDDSFGTNPELGLSHEARPPDSCYRSPGPHRNARPRFDGGHARERTDRRAQSGHAPDDRSQRVAVRGR